MKCNKHAVKSFELFDVKLEEGEDKKKKIKGYASTFGNKDAYNDIMMKGCFKKSLKANGGVYPVLFNHDRNVVIGINIKAEETAKGLKIESELLEDENIPKAKEVFAIIKSFLDKGAQMGLSVGGFIKEAHYNKGSGAYEITEFALHEHSVTPWPANIKAQISSCKSLFEGEEDMKSGIHLDEGVEDEPDSSLENDNKSEKEDEDRLNLLHEQIVEQTKAIKQNNQQAKEIIQYLKGE